MKIDCPFCERSVVLDFIRRIAVHEPSICDAFVRAERDAGNQLVERLLATERMRVASEHPDVKRTEDAAEKAAAVLNELPVVLRVMAAAHLLTILEREAPGIGHLIGQALIGAADIAVALRRPD